MLFNYFLTSQRMARHAMSWRYWWQYTEGWVLKNNTTSSPLQYFGWHQRYTISMISHTWMLIRIKYESSLKIRISGLYSDYSLRISSCQEFGVIYLLVKYFLVNMLKNLILQRRKRKEYFSSFIPERGEKFIVTLLLPSGLPSMVEIIWDFQ